MGRGTDETDVVARDQRGVVEVREHGGRDAKVSIQVVQDSGEKLMRVGRI